WTFDVDGTPIEAVPRNRLEVNTAANCVAAAVGGAGITRLFDYQIPDELTSGALIPILLDFDVLPGIGQFPHLQSPEQTVEEIRASFR
ncbi:hypothetical protein ACC677_37015, partial [Rhizobium ruizarguesonis]